jgi:hypothetical protein
MIKEQRVVNRKRLKQFWRDIGRIAVLVYLIGICIWVFKFTRFSFFPYIWVFGSFGISIMGCFFVWGKREPKKEYDGDK